VRIALVVPGGVDRSGEYRVIPALLALLKRLSAHHDVHVFALYQEAGEAKWHLSGAHIHNIGSRFTRLRAVRAIRALHKSSPFNLVHAIWSGPCGVVAVTAARMLGIPSLVHIGGGELIALPEIGYGGALKWHSRVRERLVLRRTAVISAASEPTIGILSRMGLKGIRVPLGVDLASWPPREPVRRALDQPARLIHVASLNPVKDQATLLHALATAAKSGSSFELDIVGEDVLHGEIQRLARHLGLIEKIHFRGFLPQSQLRTLMNAADLMILSSRHETGPVAVLEAAVAGVPTVGTGVGHVVELAPEAAVSVPVGDPTALAAAICRLLADEELRLRIARAAFERATREDADYTATRFEGLYSRLVASKR
jgi:glycosyltransferase involved in cell wall biosynthesis